MNVTNNSTNVRVLHWYPHFLMGGAVAGYVSALANAEAEAGADVAIAAIRPSGANQADNPTLSNRIRLLTWVPAWSLRFGMAYMYGVPSDSRKQLREAMPDVVHVHGEYNPSNIWVPLLFHCPTVLSPHGGCHRELLKKRWPTLKRLYFAVAKAVLYDRISCFHALSPDEERELRARLPRYSVQTIPGGPNPRLAINRRTRSSGSLSVDLSGPLRLLYVGRLDVFTKGLDILLDSLAAVADEMHGGNWQLELAGPDCFGGRARLQEQARALGIEHHVTFLGFLSGNELLNALDRADLYVQLSRHEGFGAAALEAICAGKPAILSSNVGLTSFPEVRRLPHVITVPLDVPTIAHELALTVRALPALMRFGASHRRGVSEHFSWGRIARLQLALYARLIHPGEQAASPRSHRFALRPTVSSGTVDPF